VPASKAQTSYVHTTEHTTFVSLGFVDTVPLCCESSILNVILQRNWNNSLKTGTHWQQSRSYRRQSTLLPICCRFRQQSTSNKVDRVEFNFQLCCQCVPGLTEANVDKLALNFHCGINLTHTVLFCLVIEFIVQSAQTNAESA